MLSLPGEELLEFGMGRERAAAVSFRASSSVFDFMGLDGDADMLEGSVMKDEGSIFPMRDHFFLEAAVFEGESAISFGVE